jgi:hypothetical protein
MSVSFLHIEHAITADMDDGQALPPIIEYDAVWCVVDRSPENKTTLWRRITLQTDTAPPSPAAARSRGDLFGGRSKDQCRK